MSNLYYSYRGESAGQRSSTAPTHLSSTSNDALQLQQGVPIRSPAQPSISFSNHQAWASDQPIDLQSHPQQPPEPSVNSSFQTTQQRPQPSLPMNATRAPIASRQTQYEDNLFPIIGKPFSDNSSRHQPASSPSTDQYAQLRPSQASNVFDPSEFPSLGGAAQNSSSIQQTHAPSSLLSSSNATESTGLGGVGISASGINPLGHFADLYGMGPYGDGRTKAVDALTGASAASEFSMQSEDFPALGGAQGTARASNGTAHLGSHSAAVPLASSLGKVPPSDNLYERQGPSASASQPHGILGRSHTQSALLMGRSAHLANGYQLGESPPSSSVLSMERESQLASLQHKRNSDDALPSATYSLAALQFSSQSRGKNALGESTRGLGETDAHSRRDILRSRNATAPNALSSFPNGQSRMPRVSAVNGPASQPPVTSSTLSRLGISNQDDMNNVSGANTNAADKYGMKALLPIVLPLSEGNGNVENVLSVGLDLTALGLNLNSSEPLHKTFENPWDGGQNAITPADNTGSSPKSHEPEYKLPTCYYMQPPPLISSQFSKFQLETLFYIFYNMPRDVLQLLAAVELYSRKWRYHKDLKLWFTCDTEANGNYDSIGYTYFDISSWEKRQFHEANQSFIQGLMTEDELKSVKIPPL